MFHRSMTCDPSISAPRATPSRRPFSSGASSTSASSCRYSARPYRTRSRRKGTAHLQQPRREGVSKSHLDICKQQAKQLVRWHREGNSIGGRIRGLARYKTLTDREALALEFPLREAQEIIALEGGYA